MSRIIFLIDRTTPILKASEAEYEKVKKDSKLRFAFHQAGKKLAVVKNTLELVKSHLQNQNLNRKISTSIPLYWFLPRLSHYKFDSV